MFKWLFQKFNNTIISIWNYNIIGKIFIIAYTVAFISTCLFFLDIDPEFYKKFFPNGNSFDDYLYIFVTFNFIYIIYTLSYCFVSLIDFFYYFTMSFIYDDYYNNIDVISFNINMCIQSKGSELLSEFYAIGLYNLYHYFRMYKEIYINNYLFHEVLHGLNTPLFIYFGLLFLSTTIISLFLLSYFGFYGVFLINLITLILFWISISIYINIFFIDNITFKLNLGRWFNIFILYPVFFELHIDSISYSFMFLTTTIALSVYIYTFSYFRYEPNVERLILLINLFVISMVCLVTSGNFFVLFLGWELIGLTSFFLINFWSTRMSTLKSAFKAFTFNKFSDVSLLIAILLVFSCINDVNIINFNNQITTYTNYYINIMNINIPLIEIISFFFISCAFVKSAQFGFHIWLPDSMEAPVPASALIHSATLVSAGLFILLRLSPLFEFSILSYYIVPIIGSFTAFFGGLCSVYQSDIKKILAYSTISHCGFLMICYSTYIPEYTVLYLYIHGFFKAAVFLCVGNIIRFSRNYQDFRRMGGFWKYLPFECFATFICLINLCGLPFSIGFYIKHLLLIGIFFNDFIMYFILVNILGGAVFGLIYSYRLFYYVFFDFKKAKKIIYLQSNNILLFSKFYSNTTLASNISISLLIVNSYIISLYLFNIFLNVTSLGEGLDIYSIQPSQYDDFSSPLLSIINNIGYFNWLLLIIMIIIITISWRRVYKYYLIYDIISFTININIFIYMVCSLLN